MSKPRPLHYAVLFMAALWSDRALAVEEPEYTVIEVRDRYEIRRYEPYLVAEVDVAADSEREAGGNAFRILAAYIFGDNRERTKMAMTAPVEAHPDAEKDAYTYAFAMQRRYSLDTLPEPLDPRIRIRERPARYVAALRFSGSWRQENYERRRTELSLSLRADRITPASGFSLARYNSPYAPPATRRNEVLVDIDWQPYEVKASR